MIIDSLTDSEKDYTTVINEFFTFFLLKFKDHPCTNSLKRFIDSYGSDLIFIVTDGKVIMFKYFLLGVGLHNITGLKWPLIILSHMGHWFDNNLVCEIETAETEIAQKLYENGICEQPLLVETSVLAFWWADDFNQIFESSTVHGVIN